jgi:hypothetical protein
MWGKTCTAGIADVIPYCKVRKRCATFGGVMTGRTEVLTPLGCVYSSQ